MTKVMIVTLNTEMPDTAAASWLPPTAYMYLPSFVLFQMKYMTMTAATAHRMMDGNWPIFGMIVFWIEISMLPKDTPLVA